MNQAIIDFSIVQNEEEVHSLLNESIFHFEEYGNNLDALQDVLSTNVKRPFKITIKNLLMARQAEAIRFQALLYVLLVESTNVDKIEDNVTFHFED